MERVKGIEPCSTKFKKIPSSYLPTLKPNQASQNQTYKFRFSACQYSFSVVVAVDMFHAHYHQGRPSIMPLRTGIRDRLQCVSEGDGLQGFNIDGNGFTTISPLKTSYLSSMWNARQYPDAGPVAVEAAVPLSRSLQTAVRPWVTRIPFDNGLAVQYEFSESLEPRMAVLPLCGFSSTLVGTAKNRRTFATVRSCCARG